MLPKRKQRKSNKTNHSLATNAAVPVALEGDDLLLGKDVVEVHNGAVQGHATDGMNDLACVLVVHAKVGTARLDDYMCACAWNKNKNKKQEQVQRQQLKQKEHKKMVV